MSNKPNDPVLLIIMVAVVLGVCAALAFGAARLVQWLF
jgi:hypothetical protein